MLSHCSRASSDGIEALSKHMFHSLWKSYMKHTQKSESPRDAAKNNVKITLDMLRFRVAFRSCLSQWKGQKRNLSFESEINICLSISISLSQIELDKTLHRRNECEKCKIYQTNRQITFGTQIKNNKWLEESKKLFKSKIRN